VDAQNERLLMQLINSLVQELKSDTASGQSTCTSQYFLLSPKVLRDDSYGDYCKKKVNRQFVMLMFRFNFILVTFYCNLMGNFSQYHKENVLNLKLKDKEGDG
ncbi:hypothetical protein D917_10218, partial [Trichinella nativa]